jgi:hypothetical protein
MKQTIKVKESILRQMIKEAVEGVLYPRGGNIGGEHQKSISDKEFDNAPIGKYGYTKSTVSGFNVAKEKWEDRFENYFGVRNQDVVFNWLYTMKPRIENYLKDVGTEYEKNSASNLNIDLTYNPDNTTKLIVNAIGIDTKTPEGIREFATKIFPQMQYEFKEFTQNKNFRQE